MGEFNWTCPHCQRVQTVSSPKYHYTGHVVDVGESKYGSIGIHVQAIGCSNPSCKDVELRITTGTNKRSEGQYFDLKAPISSHRLWPESGHKPQPDFIPAPIVQDYIEASRIRDLSPKASATLSRRCIQGMIHDFCGISKATLHKEIEELKSRIDGNSAPAGVTPETIEAIDHLRSIGNIGAHMEKDINVIVDVDSGEAQALIDLIELLFEEWYVARNSRQIKLAKIKTIAEEKAEAKKVEVKSADAGSTT
jgi:Domain of unknown function (DUF4145)